MKLRELSLFVTVYISFYKLTYLTLMEYLHPQIPQWCVISRYWKLELCSNVWN